MKYHVGDVVVNQTSFTSPIGVYFPVGTKFVVAIGGTTGGRSIKLYAERCGSVVWISDGLFLVKDSNDRRA